MENSTEHDERTPVVSEGDIVRIHGFDSFTLIPFTSGDYGLHRISMRDRIRGLHEDLIPGWREKVYRVESSVWHEGGTDGRSPVPYAGGWRTKIKPVAGDKEYQVVFYIEGDYVDALPSQHIQIVSRADRAVRRPSPKMN